MAHVARQIVHATPVDPFCDVELRPALINVSVLVFELERGRTRLVWSMIEDAVKARPARALAVERALQVLRRALEQIPVTCTRKGQTQHWRRKWPDDSAEVVPAARAILRRSDADAGPHVGRVSHAAPV